MAHLHVLLESIERTLIRAITSGLPIIRGSGTIANNLAKFFARKPRQNVITEIHGVALEVNPHEIAESGILFAPQLYDAAEFSYLKDNIKKDDTFVDLGACIGVYSVICASLIGERGNVLAVEAVPENYKLLSRNIQLNNLKNILALNVGVLDSNQTHRISVSIREKAKWFKRGLSSFSTRRKYQQGIDVECYTLYSLMQKLCIRKIDGLKLDIEGLEYRVLKRFFQEINASIALPRFIIVERNRKFVENDADPVQLLLENGYEVVKTIRYNNNYILHRLN